MKKSSLLLVAAVVCGLMMPGVSEARDPVFFRNGMVVAEEPIAADVGVRVLRNGGNAVDAAVAVGFALAVTHPFAGNIGGGGFMLVRMADGRTRFIDFREVAPKAAGRDMYLDAKGHPTKESMVGWKASGVPGTVRGFEAAHKMFGTRSWQELMQPAVDLASGGIEISHEQMLAFHDYVDSLSASPESKRIFLHAGGFWQQGEVLRQPELAQTLKRIAERGADEFYEGETAHRLAEEMQKHGGLITLDDLHAYHATERKALETDYKGFHVITAPPPSSGGAGLVQMLGMLDGSGYEKEGAGSASSYHELSEVMERFYADRNLYLGDPDFMKSPLDQMLDASYIHKLQAGIDAAHATPSAVVRKPMTTGADCVVEGNHTTHFNVVDAQGNVVAVTYTINDGFGSGVTVPGLGFLLNDEMDDFAVKPGCPNLFGLVQGESNAVAAGHRPLSSMTPTIVLRNGKPFMAVGAPGGSRIITSVMQVMLNVMDFKMNVQQAIDAPRVHHQWLPDVLEYERGVSPDTLKILAAKGHKVEETQPEVMACVEGILLDDGWLQGGHDDRCGGKVAGY